MTSPVSDHSGWPSIDFTDGLVTLNSLEDSKKEDCSKKDGTKEDPFEGTTKTFGGCYNFVSGVKPEVWKDFWWTEFKDTITESAEDQSID